MDINFDLYRVFYIVVKAKTISKAAEKLYISQPAVSYSISQLERKIGGRLLFRSPKGVTLTPDGEFIFKYIEQGYNFMIMAQNKFSELKNLGDGEIRIGAGDTLCKYYLLKYLEKFNKKYPGIKIKVINRTSPETLSLLQSGEIDMGIVNLPVKKTKNIRIMNLMEIQDCFVCSDKFKSESKISIKELISYPILLLEKGSITRKYIDDFFYLKGYRIIPEIEFGSIDLLVQFAKKGFGISHVIKDFVLDELDNNNLFEVKLMENIPKRKIGLITISNVPNSFVTNKFLEMLEFI
ncbi:MAG: LysR family transcriptional regulator [Clostridiales bacterium]